MFILLSGTDGFRIGLREKELRDEFLRAHPGAETYSVDGREEWRAENESLLVSSLSGGLFSAPRIVLLRHLEGVDDAVEKKMGGLLERTSDGDDLLVIVSLVKSGRMKKTTALEAWFAKKATVETINTATGAASKKIAQEFLKRLGAKIDFETGALDAVLERATGNSGRLYHELEKLLLFSQGKKVSIDDVRSLMEEPAGESVAFPALDALVRGNRVRALALLRHEESGPDAVFKLFGLFAWQIRQALMVKDEYERGTKKAEAIADAIGAKPFSVKKLLPLLPELSLPRLEGALSRLAALDGEIKTGQTKPGVALDLFIWKF